MCINQSNKFSITANSLIIRNIEIIKGQNVDRMILQYCLTVKIFDV